MAVTKKQYQYALLIWVAVILFLLLMPASSFPKTTKLINIPHLDKIVHSFLFGVLSFLLYRNLKYTVRFNNNLSVYYIVIICVSLFGLFTEVMQGLMYNTAKRNFSWADLFFDFLASVVVTVAIYCCNKYKAK
ncbi:MAG: VanZ family protein [Bacteroidales bacterium]|nr:VanZ family protein [Bacteroidales bacterium]